MAFGLGMACSRCNLHKGLRAAQCEVERVEIAAAAMHRVQVVVCARAPRQCKSSWDLAPLSS